MGVKMSRWFRFYDEALNDPKVQLLDGETFKHWVNILCLASRNGGKLSSVEEIAFALRIDNNACVTVVERLLNGGLIDRLNGGPNGWHYAPHGWQKRQYKSDSSNERVKRYRQRKCNVTETPPDTDTDNTLAKASDAPASSDKQFWDNAKAYIGGKSPGALIGRWLKEYTKDEVAKAITAAQIERVVDPVPYVTAVLKKRYTNGKAGGYEYPIV